MRKSVLSISAIGKDIFYIGFGLGLAMAIVFALFARMFYSAFILFFNVPRNMALSNSTNDKMVIFFIGSLAILMGSATTFTHWFRNANRQIKRRNRGAIFIDQWVLLFLFLAVLFRMLMVIGGNNLLGIGRAVDEALQFNPFWFFLLSIVVITLHQWLSISREFRNTIKLKLIHLSIVLLGGLSALIIDNNSLLNNEHKLLNKNPYFGEQMNLPNVNQTLTQKSVSAYQRASTYREYWLFNKGNTTLINDEFGEVSYDSLTYWRRSNEYILSPIINWVNDEGSFSRRVGILNVDTSVSMEQFILLLNTLSDHNIDRLALRIEESPIHPFERLPRRYVYLSNEFHECLQTFSTSWTRGEFDIPKPPPPPPPGVNGYNFIELLPKGTSCNDFADFLSEQNTIRIHNDGHVLVDGEKLAISELLYYLVNNGVQSYPYELLFEPSIRFQQFWEIMVEFLKAQRTINNQYAYEKYGKSFLELENDWDLRDEYRSIIRQPNITFSLHNIRQKIAAKYRGVFGNEEDFLWEIDHPVLK